MLRNKQLIVAAFILYFFVSLVVIITSLPKNTLHENPRLFFQDETRTERLNALAGLDHDGTKVLITRIFYNKIFFSFHDVFLSMTKATDPVFLFSLSKRQLYSNNQESFLPFWEFPLFILASFTIIRKGIKNKNLIKSLFFMITFSLLFVGLLLPGFFLRFLPLMITMHTIIGIGIYRFFVAI